MSVAGDHYQRFSQQLDETCRTRSDEIVALQKRLGASRPDDGSLDEAIDDELAEVLSALSAGAANSTGDDEADAAISEIERLFSSDVTNAPVERRLAALLLQGDDDVEARLAA